jgi:ribosome-binding ATPase
MKVGIAGFAGSGKSTVFHWLTGVAPDGARSQQGQLAKPEVPDERLEWCANLFKPKKKTLAKIEFLDTPGLDMMERRDNARRLGILRDASGLLVILSGHAGGNLADEYRKFRDECLIADLEIVTNRADRLTDVLKKPRPPKEKEKDQLELDVLKKVQTTLEANLPASKAHLKDDEEKVIRSLALLTLKKQLVFVNQGEDGIGKPLPADLLEVAPDALGAPAKLELELEELSEEDRKAFMADLGIVGFSRGDTVRKIFGGMGQIVFFTVGEDECRSWAIPKGANAAEAAGEIHTDLMRGFIRGEVVSYADFHRLGSMKEAKSNGVYRQESKTYIVQDGDIMNVLAST